MRLADSETADLTSPASTRRTIGAEDSTMLTPSEPRRGTATLLALQRSAGNTAVTEMLGTRTVEHRSSGHSHTPRRLNASPAAAMSPSISRILTSVERSERTLTSAERSERTLTSAERSERPVPTSEPAPAESETAAPDGESSFVSVREPMDGAGDEGGSADDSGADDIESEGLSAIEQSRMITTDSEQSATEVRAIAATRRAEISRQFGGLRGRIAATLGSASGAVQAFLAARQTEVTAVSTSMLTTGQSLLTSTVQSTRERLEQSRVTLHGIADSATAGLAAPVNQAAGRITGVVDALPLPDLPGISTVRAGIRSLAGRAAGAVTAAISTARGLIAAALQSGTQALASLVSSAGDAARSLLGRVATTVQRAVGSIVSRLRGLGSAVVTRLRTAVNGHLLPAINRAESTVMRNLSTAEQHALTALRDGRVRHLQTLAGDSGAGGDDDPVGDAKADNASIVTAFRERTTGILGSIFDAVAAGAAAVHERIGQIVGRVTDAIAGPLALILGRIREVGAAVRDFLQSLVGDLTGAITKVVDGVRRAVQDPVDAVVRFASDAAGRVGRFFSGIGARLFRGDFSLPGVTELVGDPRASGGPITKPKPGPITLPGLTIIGIILAAVGAIALYYVPQLALAVAAVLTWLGITVGPAVFLVIVGAVALLALAVLLLLIYLLYKTLTKPRTPKPVTIKHKTALPAPDGSGKSRNDVGVGEKVVFTGSASGSWTASAGRPTSGSGKKFTWTAPNRTASVTVTLHVGAKSASETLSVVEPNSITAVRNSTIAMGRGNAGAGMKLSFHYHPKTVSFGNTMAKEVSGPATNIKGYYRKHNTDADLRHDSGDTFFPVKDDNVDSAEDEASTRETDTPFEPGTFDWVIPNNFKVKTERGNGKKFTEVTQAFKMLDATGRVRIDKAGADVERSPSDP